MFNINTDNTLEVLDFSSYVEQWFDYTSNFIYRLLFFIFQDFQNSSFYLFSISSHLTGVDLPCLWWHQSNTILLRIF